MCNLDFQTFALKQDSFGDVCCEEFLLAVGRFFACLLVVPDPLVDMSITIHDALPHDKWFNLFNPSNPL